MWHIAKKLMRRYFFWSNCYWQHIIFSSDYEIFSIVLNRELPLTAVCLKNASVTLHRVCHINSISKWSQS